MCALIRRIANSDSAVKAVFDHIRNMGLCAVVLAAAGWKWSNLARGWERYLDATIGVVLVLLGFALFWINQANGLSKLRQLGLPAWWVHVYIHLYAFVSVSIIFSLVSR
jgi:hypothetical protein